MQIARSVRQAGLVVMLLGAAHATAAAQAKTPPKGKDTTSVQRSKEEVYILALQCVLTNWAQVLTPINAPPLELPSWKHRDAKRYFAELQTAFGGEWAAAIGRLPNGQVHERVWRELLRLRPADKWNTSPDSVVVWLPGALRDVTYRVLEPGLGIGPAKGPNDARKTCEEIRGAPCTKPPRRMMMGLGLAKPPSWP